MEEHHRAATAMEELRRAAIAYYNNSSPEVRQLAYNFFMAMDSNRDGRVSLPEFTDFLRHTGYAWAAHYHSFADFDRDRDGRLDFWEVLTLYYVVKTRDLVCQTCGACPKGLYFTCVVCFDRASEDSPTYDLCPHCYSHRSFSHSHGYFLDNYALLRSKRGSGSGSGSYSTNSQSSNQQFDEYPSAAPSMIIGWWNAFRALEVAIAIGGLAAGASGCTIM